MAKGDVTLRFDAQTAAAVQGILAARNALDAASVKARQFGEDAAKAGENAHGAFEKFGDGASEIGIKLLGISSGVGLAEKALSTFETAFETYFERMRQKAEILLGNIKAINAGLAGAGQEQAAPAIRARLEKMVTIGGETVNPKEANAFYGSISRAVGNRVTPEDKLEATKMALLGRVAQMDETGAQELGVNFAQLTRERRPGGAFEGYSNERLGDMAKQVTENIPGGLSDKQMRFFGRSKNKNEALMMLFAAAQSDEAAKGLMSIQAAADEEIGPAEATELLEKSMGGPSGSKKRKSKHPVKPLTDEESRKLRILELQRDGADVAHAMFMDETLAPASDRLAIRRLRVGASRIPASRGISEELESQERNADTGTKLANQAREAEAANASLDQGSPDSAEFALTQMNRTDLRKAYYRLSHPQLSKIPGLAAFAAQGDNYELSKKSNEDLIREIREMNATLRTRRDTTLSNNSEGQK